MRDGTPVFYKNLPQADLIIDSEERASYLVQKINEMGLTKAPIVVNLVDAQGNQYGQTMIYFEESSSFGAVALLSLCSIGCYFCFCAHCIYCF